MSREYVIALDQGTTSSRAVLFNKSGTITGISQKEFRQIFPKPGWVEHDPEEIWTSQYEVMAEVLKESGVNAGQVAAIGITNQRETTVVWDRNTGEPVHNAIVWQDKRTADYCEELKSSGLEEHVRNSTGLVIDSYFSGTKAHWILENVDGARVKAEAGELMMGTIDTWLIYKMTGGQRHVTDYTNASRTMLYNIHDLSWDEKLLQTLGVPDSMLPEVQPSGSQFGEFDLDGTKIPILGVAGDQQAALFGQQCWETGMAKNTYGTGCFLLMNIGNTPYHSQNGLLTTIAADTGKEPVYALEGSIFIAGAAIQWLRDGLKIIASAPESETLAQNAGDHYEVYMVPAFAGLGAPYWDMYARGAIFGLTRDSGQEEIAKATLESLAYQTKDVVEAMQQDSGIDLKELRVDGGAVANNYLMQFQADILNVNVERPSIVETTAMGAAYLAGITAGLWDREKLKSHQQIDKIFEPGWDEGKINDLYNGWKKAVDRTRGWLKQAKDM